MARMIADIGGLCFGASAFMAPTKLRSDIVGVGCGMFGLSALLDLFILVFVGVT